MGKFDNEDNLMIKCSPVVKYNGNEVFLVNVSVNDENGSKYCGIQFPQQHVSYNEGFSREDVEELLSMLSRQEEQLRHEAELMPPLPDDVPLDDFDLI